MPKKIYEKLPVKFPIELTIKEQSSTFKHLFRDGMSVDCIYCGKMIILNQDTVFRYDHPYDDNVKVMCRKCGKTADLVYYANKKNRKELKDIWGKL